MSGRRRLTDRQGFTPLMIGKAKNMKRIILVSLLVLQTVAMTGCNTVAGAGEDVSHAGHEVTGEANEHR